MLGGGRVREISDLVSRFGGRRGTFWATLERGSLVVRDGGDGVFPTRGLGRFLDSLRGRDAPVVLDIGAVVGANVTFFGEQLGCKLLLEDLSVELERLARQDGGDDPATSLRLRSTQEDATVDGVLCWDVLERVDITRGQALADEFTRILRPGGVLLVMFSTETRAARGHTKYEIVDHTTLRHRFCASQHVQQRVLQSREVTRMFNGLAVADSFLLTHRMREMLFRKVGH